MNASATAATVALEKGLSVRQALARARETLEHAGCPTPRLDCELLLAHALGCQRARLLIDDERTLAERELEAFRASVDRRARLREPVAYLLGRRAFRDIELEVDARALIPRPETELLVEIGCALPAGSAVIDVGTGSGAVALALKHERPDLTVSASDVDARALELARANARRLSLEVRFLRADLLDAVPDGFDAVIANLPYVAEHERASLQAEILDHEPAHALFAGRDGLRFVRPLIGQAAARARVSLLALEVGMGQARAVAALMRSAGLQRVRIERDLAGIERVVIGERERRAAVAHASARGPAPA